MLITLIILASGALIGAGVWLAVREALPTSPVLADVVANLDPASRHTVTGPQADTTAHLPLTERVALAAQARSSRLRTLTAPTADLELLGRTVQHWLGEKLVGATVCFLLIPAVNLILSLIGAPLPTPVVGIGTILLTTGGWILPDINTRTEAAKIREEAAHPISALYDLIVLEARAGSTVLQSLHRVANSADSWLFTTIRDELNRATLAQREAWDAIRDLGDRLHLPDLTDLGDILRLGGREDASIVPALAAKAQSLRDRELNRAQEEANGITQKLAIPTAGLATVVLLVMLYPSLIILVRS